MFQIGMRGGCELFQGLVVMHGCGSRTLKKAEHQRIDAFEVGAGELVLEKTLESPLDSKEIKPINPKGNQP